MGVEDETVRDFLIYLNYIFICGLMIGVATQIDLKAFKEAFKKPKGAVLASSVQFVLMPALAFAGAAATDIKVHYAVGLLIVGTCPGGVLSNVMCLLLKANLTLSAQLTAVSCFVALFMLPLNLYLYLGVFTNWDSIGVMSIDWLAVTISSVLIILGLLLGIVAQQKTSPKFCKILKLTGLVMGIGQGIIALILNSGSNQPLWELPFPCFVAMLVPLSFGFAFTLFFAHRVLKMEKSQCLTLGIEAGVQNTSIAIGILTASISDDELRAQALAMPMVYATMSGVACGVCGLILWRLGWSESPKNVIPCFDILRDKPPGIDGTLPTEVELEEA